jgi:hypothetical protein
MKTEIFHKFSQLVPALACIAALSTLFLLARHHVHQPPLNHARESQRSNYLTEAQTSGQNGIIYYDWQDREKEIVRLPIQRAMELTVAEWTDPQDGRSNLLERAEVFLAVPTPLVTTTNSSIP